MKTNMADNLPSSGIHWPESEEMRVPFRVFTDQVIFEREQQLIFRGPHWSYAGLEAEIPEPSDFKSTFIGDTPIVVTRDKEGAVHAWVNRCAHRGAMVCRDRSGKAEQFTCVYHQWAYGAQGDLMAVPFRRGVAGKGGMPEDFDMSHHGLTRLRVALYRGLVFVTFASEGEVQPLEQYLGIDVCQMLDRIFKRPLKVLGDERQVMHANWKLYSENVRDAYHGSLLHLFHGTFGLYRASQKGSSTMDDEGRHSLTVATREETRDTQATAGLRTYQAGKFALEDPSLLAGRPEFGDAVSLVILGIFPNLVVQQISNTLAVRHLLPRSADEMELVWTYFGFDDDDESMQTIRLKQMNLVGPGGLISMEDGEAIEIVQQGVVRDGDKTSYIAMGGKQGGPQDNLVNEAPIIGFWNYYRKAMGYAP